MTTDTRTIALEQFIAAPPAEVWAALTDPELLGTWWAPGNIAAKPGHEFLMEMPGWGNVPCTVTAVEDGQLLEYTFADWTLRWRIEAEGAGTRVFLEHRGFDLENPQHRFAYEQMSEGWRDDVLPSLAKTVEAKLSA